MNTIKTIVFLSLLGAFGAHAAAMQQVAIDESDNRGMSLLLDDKYTPGQVIVSGVSTSARQAGALPGDVLKSICTQPANLRHFGDLAGVAGNAKVDMTIGGKLVNGKVPTAIKTDANGRVLLTQAISFNGKSTLPAGAEIRQVCVPVRTIAEKVSVVAPFDNRSIDGRLVKGDWVPMEYHFERDGVPVIIRNLTASNPPQKIASRK